MHWLNTQLIYLDQEHITIKYKLCIKKTDVTEIRTWAIHFKSNALDHYAKETYYKRLLKCYVEIC